MPSRKASRPALPGAIELRFHQVRQELQQLDYFLKGTVLKRMMKCGQPQCACHRDPSRRHGPYFEWTYKVQGKTVNVKLSRNATDPTCDTTPVPPTLTDKPLDHALLFTCEVPPYEVESDRRKPDFPLLDRHFRASTTRVAPSTVNGRG